ncbi:MAG TPA: DUF4278 domain-containing protein [Crinalium sp.]|jgi:YHS domain-containing protein
MQLIYRGSTFNYEPSEAKSSKARQATSAVRNAQSPAKLIYRGSTYSLDPNAKSAKATAPESPYKLIYRGSTYVVSSSN